MEWIYFFSLLAFEKEASAPSGADSGLDKLVEMANFFFNN